MANVTADFVDTFLWIVNKVKINEFQIFVYWHLPFNLQQRTSKSVCVSL